MTIEKTSEIILKYVVLPILFGYLIATPIITIYFLKGE